MSIIDTVMNLNPRDAREGVDPANLPDDTRQQWSAIPRDEQAEIIGEWLYTQPDHRSLCEELINDLGAGGNGIDFVARVMVRRGSNRGWTI